MDQKWYEGYRGKERRWERTKSGVKSFFKSSSYFPGSKSRQRHVRSTFAKDTAKEI